MLNGLILLANMLEGLVGRPTSEILPYLAKAHPDVSMFFVAGFNTADSSSAEEHVNRIYPLAREEVLQPDWLVRLMKNNKEPFWGLISTVVRRTAFEHIPMLDLDEGSEERSVEFLKSLLESLRQPSGVIASSGRGLHYIGGTFLPSVGYFDRQVAALRAVKGSSIDSRWLDISRQRGFFELRLNSGGGKPIVPTIIDVYRINPEVYQDFSASRDFPQIRMPFS